MDLAYYLEKAHRALTNTAVHCMTSPRKFLLQSTLVIYHGNLHQRIYVCILFQFTGRCLNCLKNAFEREGS